MEYIIGGLLGFIIGGIVGYIWSRLDNIEERLIDYKYRYND